MLGVAHQGAGRDLQAAAAYRAYLAARGAKPPAGMPPDNVVRTRIEEIEVRVEGVGLRLVEDALRELDRMPASSAKVARGTVVQALARAGRDQEAVRAASGGPLGMTVAAARAALELVQQGRPDRADDAFRIATRLASSEPTVPPPDHETPHVALIPPGVYPTHFETPQEEAAFRARREEQRRKLEEERAAETERREAPVRPVRDHGTLLILLALVEKEAGFGGRAWSTFQRGSELLASSDLHFGRSPELLRLVRTQLVMIPHHDPSCRMEVFRAEPFEPFIRRGDTDPPEARQWPAVRWSALLTGRGPIDLSDPAFTDLPARMRGIEERSLEEIPSALAELGGRLLDAVDFLQHNRGGP